MRRCDQLLITWVLLWLSSSQAWTTSDLSRRIVRHAPTRRSLAHHNDEVTAERSTPTPPKSTLEKSGGVLYRKSVFNREELSTIRQEITAHKTQLQEECSSSIAQKRLGTTLDPEHSQVVHILKTGSLHRLVDKVVGSPCHLSTNLPVEIRAYSRPGAGMAWHVDDVLYDPPQMEVIWTLENDSDCQTMWKEGEVLHSVETEPNSAVVLLAGGASHCVTHLKYGSRIILKFAFVKEGSRYLDGQHKNQFDDKRKKNKKGKRSKR